MMIGSVARLLAVLILPEVALGDPIERWDFTHLQALKQETSFEPFKLQGVSARDEVGRQKKSKSYSMSSSQKQTKHSMPSKTSKSSKSSKTGKSLSKGHKDDYSSDHAVSDATNLDCSEDILAVAPETYCVEWIPGIGFSQVCSSAETEQRGGQVCNLVSKAWLRALAHQGHKVDIVLNHAGLCQADILMGAVTQDDVDDVLPANGYKIVLVQMTGADIKSILQYAAEVAYDGEPMAYPYGSAIRFKVDYDRDMADGFVYDIQVKPGYVGSEDDWHAVQDLTTYVVAANSLIVGGGMGYDRFVDIPDSQKTQLGYTGAELFILYLDRKCVLEGAPFSTLSFDGLDSLLSGAYSCLEDEDLCECGFC